MNKFISICADGASIMQEVHKEGVVTQLKQSIISKEFIPPVVVALLRRLHEYFSKSGKRKTWLTTKNNSATLVTLAGTAQYPVPVGTAAAPVLRLLQMGTAGTAGTVDASGYCTVPVGTAGYCGYYTG
jgi:hypothetical protein